MRKKITMLVAVLVGLLAFGVACSPALSDQLLPIRMARLSSSGRGGVRLMPRRITAKPT